MCAARAERVHGPVRQRRPGPARKPERGSLRSARRSNESLPAGTNRPEPAASGWFEIDDGADSRRDRRLAWLVEASSWRPRSWSAASRKSRTARSLPPRPPSTSRLSGPAAGSFHIHCSAYLRGAVHALGRGGKSRGKSRRYSRISSRTRRKTARRSGSVPAAAAGSSKLWWTRLA